MAAIEGQGDEMVQGPQGPPGWEVEARPRTNEKYKGKIDWFYYEPGTDKQYRSHKKAWARYEETKRVQERTPDGFSKPRKPNMKKLARMRMRTASFNIANPPKSVTWVLTDVENDKWTPYIGDEMVPEAEQKLWAETFEFAMLWKDWPGSEGGVDAEQKDKKKSDQTEKA